MSENRKFGISLFLAFVLVSGLFLWRGHPTLTWIFGVAGVVTLAALLFAPGLMKYPRAGLMAVGWLNGRLVLALVFYLVFTPMGMLMRIFKKDPLAKRWDKNLDSYWIVRASAVYDPHSTERQY